MNLGIWLMTDNSFYSNLGWHCNCPSSFLLKATAHVNRVTTYDDDGGFKLVQAWNCGVKELARDFGCCACSWRGDNPQSGDRVESAPVLHCCTKCCKSLWDSPKQMNLWCSAVKYNFRSQILQFHETLQIFGCFNSFILLFCY